MVEEARVEILSVSSRGQIVLPQRLREEVGIHEGDKLVCARDGNTLLVRKLETQSLVDEFEELGRRIRARLKGRIPSDDEIVAMVRRQRQKDDLRHKHLGVRSS